MADLKSIISKYKVPIVFVGLIVGLINVFNVIPNDLLGEYTKLFVAGVIIISGLIFYDQYVKNNGRGGRFQQPPSRTPSRDYSNPEFRQQYNRGNY